MSLNIGRLLPLIILVINVLALYSLLTRKRWWPLSVAGFALTLAVALPLGKLLRQWVEPASLVSLLLGYIFLVPTLCLFRESWQVKSFVFLMIFTSAQYFGLIFMFLRQYSQQYWGSGGETLTWQLWWMGLQIATLLGFYFYFLRGLRALLPLVVAGGSKFLLLPLGACSVLALIRLKNAFDLYSLVLAILLTGIMLAAVSLLQLTRQLLERQSCLESNLALQVEHYKRLTTSIEQSQNYRRDIRCHLAGVAKLLQQEALGATEDYLAGLNQQYDTSVVPRFCANQYVDAVVANYYQIARQEQLRLTLQLALPEVPGIDNLDLCVIIGNCLENAIEACRLVGEGHPRTIKLCVQLTHGYVALTLKNSCVHQVQRRSGGFLSSKQEGRLGQGLASVELLAHKYEGELRVYAQEGIFTTEVDLKLPSLGVQ
ncbi:MAG: GHKL domain-containing protein [Acidaminococcaceae bacterium]